MFIKTSEETSNLMQVAAGAKTAELALVNGKVLNVYTGELIESCSICTEGPWIAYVGSQPDTRIGPNTQVIDLQGKTVIPGLIDGHMHLSWLSSVEAFLEYAPVGGTTAIVTETIEPYPIVGLGGVLDFLESCKDQPVKIFATAPTLVSTSRTARGIRSSDLAALLDREEVVGLGESYWQGILQDPDFYLPSLVQTLKVRKVLEGHTAGASESKLMAYVSAGISSCHEPIQPEEIVDRLRLGLHVMIREGSIRRDLNVLARVKDMGVSLRRLILVSDGVTPTDLLEKGYMEYLVQKALDCGFDPVESIRMATLNVAEHFRLDHLIGGISPGRFADLVIIPDLRTIRAEQVISNGKIIAREGKLLTRPKPHTFAPEVLHSVQLKEDFTARSFTIRSPNRSPRTRIRVIEMVTDLVTKERILDLEAPGGEIQADPVQGLAKVAAIDRAKRPGEMFVGLIKNFGLKSGALACSAAWDTSDIIVVGCQDEEMARAVNRIIQLQGGAVLADHGKIIAELPLPIFGVLSEMPLKDIDRQVKEINTAAAERGIAFPDPLLSLIVLTGPAIPFLRICEEGLVSIKDGKTLGLFVEN
jgi:adenine deaminase